MADAKRSLDLDEPRRVGRFEMFSELASGGFASIHLGRTVGVPGFAKTVAIKRLHRQYARNPDTRRMFLDEARVVARIQHPNVVSTLDLIEEDDELFLVMEYVMGVTLAHLLKLVKARGDHMPVGIVLRVMSGALEGLHAAHQAVDEHGQAMCVIHRDVTPDNILVGVDGHARLLDFGVAKAMGQHYATREGEVKGKLAFLSPEQVNGEEINHQTDIFSAAAVLWECLTGRRLFVGRHFGELIQKIAEQPIVEPSSMVPGVPTILDSIVMRGLKRDRAERWDTALKMAEALESLGGLVSSREVGKWVRDIAQQRLEERLDMRAAVEGAPRRHDSTVEELVERGSTPAGPGDGSRPAADDDLDDDTPGAEDWDGADPGDGAAGPSAIEHHEAGAVVRTEVQEERPETSGERPVRQLVDAASGGRAHERAPAAIRSEPPPARPAASARTGRAGAAIVIVGALAFIAVIVALVVTEMREREGGGWERGDGPQTGDTAAPTPGAPTAAPTNGPAATAPEREDASTLDPTDASAPARQPVVHPRRPPGEFTPGGI